MDKSYRLLLDQANANKKSIKKKSLALKKLRKGGADKSIHGLHEEAFEQIDCLKCANCCITTGPLFNNKDIDRIAGHLGVSSVDFIEQYLRVDEEHDYVLKSTPCTFLREDNICSIYEVRPKACREYPHTDRVNQLGILSKTQKNALICPAVAYIFENISL